MKSGQRFVKIARRIQSDDYQVLTLSSQYRRLIQPSGGEESTLLTFAQMQPSIFKGFRKVVMCSALFEQSLLFALWTAAGTKFTPVSKRWRENLRYSEHANGAPDDDLLCSRS